jgi:hypothetical protein
VCELWSHLHVPHFCSMCPNFILFFWVN